MEFSKEEKKAIDYLKENSLVRIENEKIVAYGNSYKLILLNLIDNQQKEIEKYEQQIDLEFVEKNFIEKNKVVSKDKIREKKNLYIKKLQSNPHSVIDIQKCAFGILALNELLEDN